MPPYSTKIASIYEAATLSISARDGYSFSKLWNQHQSNELTINIGCWFEDFRDPKLVWWKRERGEKSQKKTNSVFFPALSSDVFTETWIVVSIHYERGVFGVENDGGCLEVIGTAIHLKTNGWTRLKKDGSKCAV